MEIIIAGKKCRANNQASFDKLKKFLTDKHLEYIPHMQEADVRRRLLSFVEEELSPNEWILYDGNSIWDVKRLMKQFKVFVKHYDYEHFTKYLYEFFSLQCGSIAHFNKSGWFATYPDLASLKRFFKSNEYGQSVWSYPPDWHYDACKATEAMHAVLFGIGDRVPYPQFKCK